MKLEQIMTAFCFVASVAIGKGLSAAEAREAWASLTFASGDQNYLTASSSGSGRSIPGARYCVPPSRTWLWSAYLPRYRQGSTRFGRIDGGDFCQMCFGFLILVPASIGLSFCGVGQPCFLIGLQNLGPAGMRIRGDLKGDKARAINVSWRRDTEYEGMRR